MADHRRILVVEDDPDLRRTLERCLTREGCETAEARDGQEAIEALESGRTFDLILTDLEMPRLGGREVLRAGVKRQIPVVVLTGHGTVQTAVDLMRDGAANFLTKPFSPSSLRAVLEDTFGRRTVPRSGAAADTQPLVIGQEPPFRLVLDLIDRVAETDATVLVCGESGTGKEVVARAIHQASRRAHGPFIAVNCGAIPEALLESELFGHARGAFTGATHARAGRFQLADGGTLFLDEIGDMPLPFQVKLLRVLQERQVEMLGEGVSRPVDVRVIAATHRDLSQLIGEGKFREDLYYRLNVIEVRMPALRERRGDIPLLVSHFMQAANARHGRAVTGVSPEVLERLQAQPWPGNVRQLANVVERMVVLKKAGQLELADIPAQLAQEAPAGEGGRRALPADGIDLRKAIADLEETLIDQALSRTGGNRNAAAQLLGLNRTTLVEKLKRKH